MWRNDVAAIGLLVIAIVSFIWGIHVLAQGEDSEPRELKLFRWCFAAFLIFTVTSVFGILGVQIMSDRDGDEVETWGLCVVLFAVFWPFVGMLIWSRTKVTVPR